MLNLFFDYRNNGKTKQALLVGQNMVNRNPGNEEMFEAYFDYLIYIMESSEIDAAKVYLQQATSVLAFFSENVEINKNIVELILNKENELKDAADALLHKQEIEERKAIRDEVVYHNDALSLLEQLLDKITKCNSEKDFNIYINDLGRIDQSINRDQLSTSQEKKYTELTRRSSEVISSRMAYFENLKNRDYNIKAIEAYEKVFNMFRNGKVIEDHKDALQSLFIFDTSRLYNETLVYYNHVYNYILGKLSDEDKFKMTKYAIICEKKR